MMNLIDAPYDGPTREEVIEGIKALGMNVVEPTDFELFLDIDSEEALSNSIELIKMFNNEYGVIEKVEHTRSKSNNYHLYVTLSTKVTVRDRLLLQSLLGSDLKHEMLSYFRFIRPEGTAPTLFFELPDAKKEIISLD